MSSPMPMNSAISDLHSLQPRPSFCTLNLLSQLLAWYIYQAIPENLNHIKSQSQVYVPVQPWLFKSFLFLLTWFLKYFLNYSNYSVCYWYYPRIHYFFSYPLLQCLFKPSTLPWNIKSIDNLPDCIISLKLIACTQQEVILMLQIWLCYPLLNNSVAFNYLW